MFRITADYGLFACFMFELAILLSAILLVAILLSAILFMELPVLAFIVLVAIGVLGGAGVGVAVFAGVFAGLFAALLAGAASPQAIPKAPSAKAVESANTLFIKSPVFFKVKITTLIIGRFETAVFHLKVFGTNDNIDIGLPLVN
ncbi:MAG: hypothetical protein ABIU09_12350 [Pyrinomonadaceae bacterium]